MPELEDFTGAWRLSRVIEDARAGQIVHLEGRALFTPDEAGLVCEESGKLQLPGQAPLQATRRFLWRRAEGGIAVHFEDGRFFHLIGPGLNPEAMHDCPPDLYRVAYDFSRWPDWSTRWRVEGPRKDYAMRSTYSAER